jgi:hypothetical protein
MKRSVLLSAQSGSTGVGDQMPVRSGKAVSRKPILPRDDH